MAGGALQHLVAERLLLKIVHGRARGALVHVLRRAGAVRVEPLQLEQVDEDLAVVLALQADLADERDLDPLLDGMRP